MISFDEATKAVTQFELMKFFGQMSAGARSQIAEELMAMVNWSPERPLKNGLGEVIRYVEPRVRLARLMTALKTVDEWPGMAQIRAVYCKMYLPADGILVDYCTIPGFTEEECESGSDILSLGRAPEPKYLPQPGDEPVGDLSKAIAAGAKRITGGR